MKRDGTASDKREGDGSYAPPTESDRPPLVDEPIAGNPQTTPSSKISTLMTEVLHKENLKQALERVNMSPLREIDKWVRRRLRCYAWKQWGSAGYRDTSENAGSACGKLGIQARARMARGG